MKYELRYELGMVHQWDDTTASSAELGAVLLAGGAQLVCIDDRGHVMELLDVDDILEINRTSSGAESYEIVAGIGGSTLLVWVEPIRGVIAMEEQVSERPPFPTESPLFSIRICRSEVPMLSEGACFTTIADFDAALRAARAASADSRPRLIFFSLRWRSGATFKSSIDVFLDRDEYLGDHVDRVCAEVLKDPARERLAYAARLTVARIFLAAVAEAVARLEASSKDP